MDVGDCSLWHHLIFCEELQNDEENHEEPERHPLQNEETESEEENEETESEEENEETESEEEHEETESEEENEETESDEAGNNQVVCWVCKESVLGHPAYKCLECNFLQHKSCIDPTPAVMMQGKHDLRERHHLMFTEEVGNITGSEEQVCPGCEEPVFGPTYKCSIPGCSFFLHTLCTDLPHVIQHPVHSKHTLILRVPSKRNYCDVCLKYCRRRFFYRCSLCDYDLDVQCRSRWQIYAEFCHQHAFVRTLTQIQFTCQVCGEESKGIAYFCSICQLLIHHKCAQFQRTVDIVAHKHSLTLTYSLPQFKDHNNIFCKICYKKVNTEYATYSCQECRYIAHLNCTINYSEYAKVRGWPHRVFDDDTNLVHLVEGIKLAEDERAGPLEIDHFSHSQHYLVLIDEELMEDKRCEACMQFIISVPFYGCVKCNFFLHNRCAKLPSTIKRWRCDDHPLTLISKAPSTDGLFWCCACNRHRHGFTYKCDKCKWNNTDVQCCLIPETLEHEGHQHSLFIPELFDDDCYACGEDRPQCMFACTNCKFYLCIRCATLPLVAKHEYDTHLLKLSYAREDDSKEYYCLICEEERDHPDYWFYYCEKCNFPAHPQCVLGTNPCINYGRTYIDEDHEHPLTIVQKTKHSPPCDVCDKSFKDMASECTRCKFNVHRDCLRDMSKERVK